MVDVPVVMRRQVERIVEEMDILVPRVKEEIIDLYSSRYAPQSVGILKRLKDETTANLNTREKEELDRKTNQQGLCFEEKDEDED